MKAINKKAIFVVFALFLVFSVMAFNVGNNASQQVYMSENNTINVTKTQKSDKQVFLGGMPIGIELRVDGLIVQGVLPVVTADGIKTPLQNCDIKKGDILSAINGKQVRNMQDVGNILSQIRNNEDSLVNLELQREQNIFEITAQAVLDSISGEFRLGMSVLESVDGIGTLTFIDPDDGRFGSLGHPIIETGGTNCNINVHGNICSANVFSVYKSEKNRAGELVGNIIKSVKLGEIDKNETQGVFGKYQGDASALKKICVGKCKNVTPGKAYIVSTAFTGKPIYYEIEIIKACRQDKDKPKGILFRVKDERLIKASGGIVQGMSGSPIVQKGKLIGAVTHVFLSDSTKGYGTFIDWMIDK